MITREGEMEIIKHFLYVRKDKIQKYLITAWKSLSKLTFQNFQYYILACDLYAAQWIFAVT